MAWHITWDEFLKYATQFMTVSDEIGDGWEWKGDKDSSGGAYISKKVNQHINKTSEDEESSFMEDSSLVHEERDVSTVQVSNTQSSVNTWEYHILYSVSYRTPVLYFNAYTPEGNLLSIETLWRGIEGGACDSLRLQRWEALSQQEHPILRRPYFQLHPCKTADFLATHRNHSANPLITWLSSVGPVVGLNLHMQYACLVSVLPSIVQK